MGDIKTESRSCFHLAVIMDGNGRWACARSRPREWGHRAGARAIRPIVESAPDLGIGVLTLYAFSSDNWKRPEREVRGLLRLFRRYLRAETPRMIRDGVRLQVIGRRDRLPKDLIRAIEASEQATAGGRRITLRLAVDYSSREAMVQVAKQAAQSGRTLDKDGFAELMGKVLHMDEAVPDVDLLVRTGGEQRLSDFLLWECAYAELFFTPRMWPDFRPADLRDAVDEYARRDRRFGLVAEAV